MKILFEVTPITPCCVDRAGKHALIIQNIQVGNRSNRDRKHPQFLQALVEAPFSVEMSKQKITAPVWLFASIQGRRVEPTVRISFSEDYAVVK